MTLGAFESMTEPETEHIEFETGDPPPASYQRPVRKKMRVAWFFIPLNVAILAAFIYWVTTKPASAPVVTDELDAVAPYEKDEGVTDVSRPAAASAPASEEEKRQIDRARGKLSNAIRWRETHPEKARALAQEAIDLAPQSDVADQARNLLKQIPR